jgi:hypothetical protein
MLPAAAPAARSASGDTCELAIPASNRAPQLPAMTDSPLAALAEYFRQLAFVSSLLGGFSFAFFGTLLSTSLSHRVVGPAASLALAASTCFLVVMLGNTFAASVASNPTRTALPLSLAAHVSPISRLFVLGVALLLLSFGAAGWIRSRTLGLTTTAIAALGTVGVVWVLGPFVHP